MNLFVLHQDELNDLGFDLTNKDASQLENIQATPLVKNGLAHIVEGTVVEHDMSHV